MKKNLLNKSTTGVNKSKFSGNGILAWFLGKTKVIAVLL